MHRLHIQICNEAETDETGIKYPRVEAHKKKDGHATSTPNRVHCVTNEEITRIVEEAREMAKKQMETLGMAELLEEKKCWNNPPAPVLPSADECDDEELNDEEPMSDQ